MGTEQEYTELTNKVANIQETLQDLYKKVVSGNGQLPILSRLELQEHMLSDLSERHNQCRAQEDIITLKNTDEHTAKSIEEIKAVLKNIEDNGLYRQRERRAFVMQIVHTVIYIGLAAATTMVTSACIN